MPWPSPPPFSWTRAAGPSSPGPQMVRSQTGPRGNQPANPAFPAITTSWRVHCTGTLPAATGENPRLGRHRQPRFSLRMSTAGCIPHDLCTCGLHGSAPLIRPKETEECTPPRPVGNDPEQDSSANAGSSGPRHWRGASPNTGKDRSLNRSHGRPEMKRMRRVSGAASQGAGDS